MGGLINLIILYVIFSTVSSFVKKLKQQQMQQQAELKKSGEISRPSAKKIPEISLKEALSFPPHKGPPPLEDILDLEDDEIEFHKTELPVKPPVSQPPLSKISPVRRIKSRRSTSSLLSFDGKSYTQGIILSEILGPPVSHRNSRRAVN